ncbi:hypothetical protein BKA63DRAFT_548092 [Paraphoma chrysanthemicola]|nr:hypothetical protein BKA63DRAFT_548092 [Paraphoma chrysanthemicola]
MVLGGRLNFACHLLLGSLVARSWNELRYMRALLEPVRQSPTRLFPRPSSDDALPASDGMHLDARRRMLSNGRVWTAWDVGEAAEPFEPLAGSNNSQRLTLA